VANKVVYVSIMRLSPKVARDWFIEALAEQGTEVEYWDVASLVYGDDGHRSQAAPYLRAPTSYAELEALIARPENRAAVYMMLIPYEGRTARMYRLLSAYDREMFFISWGAMPIGGSGRIWRNAVSPLTSVRNVASRMKTALYRKLGWVNPFAAVFAAGRVLADRPPPALRVVPINLVDYDHFVRAQSSRGRPVEGRYAVFLDSYLPYQSDLKIVGMKPITAEQYYAALNRFFDVVERAHDVRVVIAAHPKARYDERTFDGRVTISNRTPELVRDAEFAISHHSTSISYAVLNRKPLMFVYTDGMLAAYRHTVVTFIRELADFLGAPVYHVEEIDSPDQAKLVPIDGAKYDAFKYGYLTSHQSEHESTESIFLREMNRLVGSDA
jgi:hypothetical protein